MVILRKLHKLFKWMVALSIPILLLSSSSGEQQTAGSDIQVELMGPTPFQNRESVSQYADLLTSNSLPINMRVLEESLSALNGVKRAEVFSDGEGGLYAEIWQAQPLVRLFELDTSYYLDTDGFPVALSPLWSESVPLLRCRKDKNRIRTSMNSSSSFRKMGSYPRRWMPLSWWKMTSSFCMPQGLVHTGSDWVNGTDGKRDWRSSAPFMQRLWTPARGHCSMSLTFGLKDKWL